MQKRTSKKLLHLMFEIGAALSQSVTEVKAAEPEEEFLKYRETVGKLMTRMLFDVINPVCVAYPDLKPAQLYGEGQPVPPTARPYRYRGLPAPKPARRGATRASG